jgi:hypothetical protein
MSTVEEKEGLLFVYDSDYSHNYNKSLMFNVYPFEEDTGLIIWMNESEWGVRYDSLYNDWWRR